jgi:hypothetical protein
MQSTSLLPEGQDSRSLSQPATPLNPCLEQQNALEAAVAEVDRAIALMRERAVAMMRCRQRQKVQTHNLSFEKKIAALLNLCTSIRNEIATACSECSEESE